MGLRVAVALGAGGARGYAHIGVLDVIAERGHEVVTIAGTSMGALVGGMAAAGKLPAYTDWARSLTQTQVLRLLDPTISGAGAIRGERVISKVREILDGARIEECAIPFTAVATDLNNRREVWFQHGPVVTAIRASIAIPSVITPVVVGGRLLVDGGLMNPVPITPTAATLSDLVVAVSLQGRERHGPVADTPHEPATPVRTPHEPTTGTWRSLASRLSTLRDELLPDEEETERLQDDPWRYHQAPKDVTTADVFNRSFDTMAALITRYRLASSPPDVLVHIPVDSCRTMEFHRAAEMIALGRDLARKAFDAAGY